MSAGFSVLQLHPELKLINARTLHPRLQMKEYPVPVHGLYVLVPVQKLRRLPAAYAGGEPLGALCNSGAQSARKFLPSAGAASGAQNRGEAFRRVGRRGSNGG